MLQTMKRPLSGRHRAALLILVAGCAAACSRGSCRFSLTRRVMNTSSDALSSSRHPLAAAAAATGGAAEYGIPGREASRRLQEEVAISGDFRQLAYFYMEVFVGTPAQKATVITDTGSTLLAFPGKSCGDCGSHMDPKFDPSRSTTISPVGCGSKRCSGPNIGCSQDRICSYSQSYAEGSSLSGVLYTDRVFIGDDDPASLSSHASYTLPDFKFGVHRHEDGLFTTQLADGIMGLGTGELSIVPALWGAGLLSKYVFSMCLSLNGGAFTLGAIDSSLHISPPAWAAMSTAEFYSVSVTGMALVSLSTADAAAEGTLPAAAQTVAALDVTPFHVKNSVTIVDSGTTFTYIPTAVFNALKAQIQLYCGDGAGKCSAQSAVTIAGESLCYRLRSFADVHTFPGVTISLAPATPGAPPVTILIPPSRLFVSMVWDRGAYCLSVYANNGIGAVLGGTSMMGYDVIFDLEGPAGPRIGWAPSACEVHEGPINGSSTPRSASEIFNLDGIGGIFLSAGLLAALVVCATCCWCTANKRCGFCCRAHSDSSGGGGRWADVSLFGTHVRIESSAAAKADAAMAAVDASFSETEPMHHRPESVHSPSSSGGGSSSSKSAHSPSSSGGGTHPSNSRRGGGRYLSTKGRAAVSSVLNAAVSSAVGLGSVKRGGGSGVGKYAVVDEEGDGGGVGGVFGTGTVSIASSGSIIPGSDASISVPTSSSSLADSAASGAQLQLVNKRREHSLGDSAAAGAPGGVGTAAAEAAAAARSDDEGFGVKLEDVQVV